MPSSWPDEENALVDALGLVISSVLALRSCVRFLLRRRRGVNVGRHAFGLKDLARSVAYSLTQTSARNQGLVVAFAAAVVGRRWLRRYVFDALFGRRPGRRTVAKVLRALAILVSRNVWAWARGRVQVVGGALGWVAHWRVRVCERPVVSCTRTFWNVAIVERAGLATREFRPVFWLTSRHAQTVIAHVLADLSFLLLRPVRWRRQAVRTFDGGEVWLDWLVAHRDEFALHGDGLFATRAPPPSPTSPVVLLLYGVGGTRDDHYMKHLARRCESRGWRAVAFSDWRLDWNEWRDLARAVEAIRASNPAAPIFCVAHSASAFLLVQYLAAAGEATPLVAAVTLAGCMDFLRTADFVAKTKNATYRKVFARGMRRCILRHARADPGLADERARREHARRVLAFARHGPAVMYDRHVAAIPRASNRSEPGSFAGFDDGAGAAARRRRPGAPLAPVPARLPRTRPHYVASSRERLRDVRIPLLVVHARDDPLVSHDDCYDWPELVRNPRVVVVRTNRGGHNAWHEGFWPLGPSWAVGVATDYVSAVLEQTAQTGWLLAVLGTLGDAAARPRAADIARVAAATDHVLDEPPAPAPLAPLTSVATSVAAILFDNDDDDRPVAGGTPDTAAAATPLQGQRRGGDFGADEDDAIDVYAEALYSF